MNGQSTICPMRACSLAPSPWIFRAASRNNGGILSGETPLSPHHAVRASRNSRALGSNCKTSPLYPECDLPPHSRYIPSLHNFPLRVDVTLEILKSFEAVMIFLTRGKVMPVTFLILALGIPFFYRLTTSAFVSESIITLYMKT
jgi:hypothetical protein